METRFSALQVKENNGRYEKETVILRKEDLPSNDILIKVNYSSVNYKDALSAAGNRGVTRNFPHVPGIDAAGTVISSASARFRSGDSVVVTGFDLGMNTWGGFGRYIRVPESWVLPLPEGLTEKEAMSLGTAGLTAGLSVHQLINAGIKPADGNVMVSGASGGVGSIAISILSRSGYKVTAITGKPDPSFLTDKLGAHEIIDRNEFIASYNNKPMAAARFAGGIDTVSGPVLSGMLKSVKYGGIVTCCGMVASAELQTSIYPFILRGVRLTGIDSVEVPMPERTLVWNKLAGEWKPDNLAEITRQIYLDELPAELDRILAGQARGRVVLMHKD